MTTETPQAPPEEAPFGLSTGGKLRYMAVVNHLAPRWNEVWEPIVHRYCLLMDAAASAMAGLPQMPDGSGPRLTTSGSQGDKQKVQHPLWRAFLDASKAAAGVAAELGITPRQMAEVENGGDDDPLRD